MSSTVTEANTPDDFAGPQRHVDGLAARGRSGSADLVSGSERSGRDVKQAMLSTARTSVRRDRIPCKLHSRRDGRGENHGATAVRMGE